MPDAPHHEITNLHSGPGELYLFATPETAEALAGADALALLVGSYDGSGNYGDICQLDATLALLDRLSPKPLAVPILERSYLQSHRTSSGEMANPPVHALFFGPEGAPADGLVPLDRPVPARSGLLYLYGGGFLNPLWGERKLAMLRAAEGLLSRVPRLARLSSGMQVDPAWISRLDAGARSMLASFQLLGARDEASAAAMRQTWPASRVLNSGDDAIGILGHLPRRPAPAADGPLEVNVHVAEHDWVTETPDRVASFVARFLTELASRAGRPLRARPLLTYVDPRVDERPAVARLEAACAGSAVEVIEPRLLRPATVADLAPELARAAVTVSCSYHAALTSLMLGIPAALLGDNAYYEQKAAGLLDDFGLPSAFSLRSSDDPTRVAGEIGALLEDPELRPRLLGAAAAVEQRRSEAEAELLAAAARPAAQPPISDSRHHEITNLRTGPGELSFEARIEGQTRRIWFRSETEVEPYPEAALAASLMPAMRSGGTLTMTEPISPRVLRMQREFQGIQQAWSREWSFGDPPLREVEVKAPVRPVQRRDPTGRVALFFSGGVDSWSTLLGEEEVTDLIFVRGLDILTRAPHQEGLADQVEARLREAASELGLPLHTVETNARDLSELNGPAEPVVRWESYYNSTLCAVALFLGPLFDRVLISTGFPYRNQSNLGSSWMVDQLWGNENLEIFDAGGNLSRVERTRRIASHPVVHKTLRVCWRNLDGAYNCGRCLKCLMTMAMLEAFGQLQNFQTFPPRLEREDLELLVPLEAEESAHINRYEEILELMRNSSKPELEQVFEEIVARKQRALDEEPEATAQLEEILNSRSWKLTAPLRRLGARRRGR
jgi:Polysaccharide pyruvyl transferase